MLVWFLIGWPCAATFFALGVARLIGVAMGPDEESAPDDAVISALMEVR